jgi:mono/diheme cytochrome c family protein
MRSIATDDHVPPLQLSEVQANGRHLYETVCWTCHGSSGRGDGPVAVAGAVKAPPSLLVGEYARMTAEDFKREFNAAQMATDHPHMRYLTSVLKPNKFEEALAYIPALVYPAEIPGSAIAGSALYERRCAACHGERGRGDGMAAEFLVLAPPADFTADSLIAAHDWPALFQRIRQGGQAPHSSMPPWGMLFTEGEMWDLVAYIATLQPGAVSPLEGATGP